MRLSIIVGLLALTVGCGTPAPTQTNTADAATPPVAVPGTPEQTPTAVASNTPAPTPTTDPAAATPQTNTGTTTLNCTDLDGAQLDACVKEQAKLNATNAPATTPTPGAAPTGAATADATKTN